MSFYYALIHQPIIFCDETGEVIEAEITLPDHIRLQRGDWISHPFLDGRSLIAAAGYDTTRGRLILTLMQPALVADYQRDEWLAINPQWKLVTKEVATVDITKVPKNATKKPPKPNTDNGDDDDDLYGGLPWPESEDE